MASDGDRHSGNLRPAYSMDFDSVPDEQDTRYALPCIPGELGGDRCCTVRLLSCDLEKNKKFLIFVLCIVLYYAVACYLPEQYRIICVMNDTKK